MTLRPDLALRRAQVDTYLTLTRLRHAIERRACALFSEAGLVDVTPAQSNVLLSLMHGREPVTARQLAARLGLSEVTVGRFVRALEERGWVERKQHPGDKRAMLVHPTAKASDKMPTFIGVANALLDEAFAELSVDQMRTMAGLTEHIRANLEPEEDE